MSGHQYQFALILSEHLQRTINIQHVRAVGGGCINQTYLLESGSGEQWFAKTNYPDQQAMFAAEMAGLQEIYHSHTLRCPKPLTHGTTTGTESDFSYLIMEYISFGHNHNRAQTQRSAGQQLAALHCCTQEQFGWHMDNTIGSTAQLNGYRDGWVTFWREQRLLPQLKWALQDGYNQRDYENGLKLCEQLSVFFHDYQPPASLLHGDLWSGNIGFTEAGQPVIFDPAVYYGDRETDLAMTEMFGGFSADFYAAYHEQWPIDKGYSVRKKLYQLYHILNHYHLFGGGYGHQASNTVLQLLSETGS
ncbi:MAG: fructosamine kinase family protein [Thiolinea sp.]